MPRGVPTINPPANAARPRQHHPDRAEGSGERSSSPTRTTSIGGKNPRGLVLNSTDTRAYVMDFVSRDVAVVDISGADPTAVQDARPHAVGGSPGGWQLDAIVQRGK